MVLAAPLITVYSWVRAPPGSLEIVMDEKISAIFIWLGLFIGSAIGSYIPCLWGESIFSLSSLIGGIIGSVVGIWIGFKLSQWLDL